MSACSCGQPHLFTPFQPLLGARPVLEQQCQVNTLQQLNSSVVQLISHAHADVRCGMVRCPSLTYEPSWAAKTAIKDGPDPV
jgi:hypothetical protein